MPSPLHIAAHNGAPEWGGAEIALTRILLGLQERGHRITFHVAQQVVADGVREMGLEPRHLHVGGDVALHHAFRVRSALSRDRPDVLIVGTFRKLLHLALGARMANVPVVSRIGMSTDVPRNAKYRFLFRTMVDQVAVNTGEIRADYLRALPGLDPARVRVLPKGLELPEPDRHPAQTRSQTRAEAGIPEDAFVVGALARLVEAKRLDRWLEAFALLPAECWGLIVGDGPLQAKLQEQAKGLGVADRVRWVGYQKEVPRWLRAMDLMLMMSDKEALANSMLEAMALEVPVVSTPVHGSGDALLGEEDRTRPGIILPDFSVAAAGASLKALYADRDQLPDMGRAARRRIGRHFTRKAEIDQWERLLREVVVRRTGARL